MKYDRKQNNKQILLKQVYSAAANEHTRYTKAKNFLHFHVPVSMHDRILTKFIEMFFPSNIKTTPNKTNRL
jgi:hypothetical protein